MSNNSLIILTFYTFVLYSLPLIGQTQNLCFGETETYSVDIEENINGSPGSHYEWSVYPKMNTYQIISNSSSNNLITIEWGKTPVGKYILTVVESNECIGTPKHIIVLIHPAPNAGENGWLQMETGDVITYNDLFNALRGNPDLGGEWSHMGNIWTYKVLGNAGCKSDSATVKVVRGDKEREFSFN